MIALLATTRVTACGTNEPNPFAYAVVCDVMSMLRVFQGCVHQGQLYPYAYAVTLVTCET